MEAVVSDFNASAPLPIVDPSDDGMMIEEGLAPYTYQKITYELAIQRNIISVLPTGKGKVLRLSSISVSASL